MVSSRLFLFSLLTELSVLSKVLLLASLVGLVILRLLSCDLTCSLPVNLAGELHGSTRTRKDNSRIPLGPKSDRGSLHSC
jgi:hypothetical protein